MPRRRVRRTRTFRKARCALHKRVMSSRGREVVADADWDLIDRAALRAELDAVARVARDLKLWVAVGGIDPAPRRSRPTNSLFVISTAARSWGATTSACSRERSLYSCIGGHATAGVRGWRRAVRVRWGWNRRTPNCSPPTSVLTEIDTSTGERSRTWRRSVREGPTHVSAHH